MSNLITDYPTTQPKLVEVKGDPMSKIVALEGIKLGKRWLPSFYWGIHGWGHEEISLILQQIKTPSFHYYANFLTLYKKGFPFNFRSAHYFRDLWGV